MNSSSTPSRHSVRKLITTTILPLVFFTSNVFAQPTATEYKVVIDNCHSSIGNEGTANTITVEFLNANRVVKTTSNKGIKECSSNAVFTIQSNENITGVNVTTNGNDGFYIDKIELFKGGRRVISHGVDDLKGWCLSTDPEDANNSWKDRTANGCQPSQFFSYSDSGSSQPTATEYKVVIDNCHSSIGNEGTANTITVEFLNANRVVKTTSNKDIKECSSNAVFTIQSNENITGVNVTTNGNDGFYIDKIELFKGGRRVISHGVDNLKGWCLSTDPEDANNSWKDRTANGCQPSQFFSYSDSGSSQPTATEYKVVIDNCHSSIGNEGTANTITVEFLNANRVVKTTSNKDIKECSSNAVFTIQSNENITGVNVTTNGNDGFYIDKIELFKGGRRVISYGVDDLKGWCLSTDPEDANNSWKDRTANGCQPSQFFSYSDSGSSQPTATEYKVVIDNCHSSIGNEGTANTITVEFLNANRVVKTTSNKDIKECSSNAVFTIQSNENITGVNVTTNGNDGFYIDKIELFKGGRRVISHGVDNLKGWCLSTDPEDANNSWKDRTANGCQPSQFFSYSDSGSSQPTATEYKVVIDNCHSSIGNEGTANTITVEFLNANRVVKTTSNKGIKECSSNAVFTIQSNENITGVNVTTNGNDGFYIDKIELFKGGRRVISHGVDDLKGWCLSTDPEDANNSWKDRTANGCQPSQFFSYSDSGSSQPTATEYKVVIDNCHSSIGNEGTANTITVEFLNANRVVKTTSNKDIKECSSNAVFTIQSNENITGVNVTTNGNDGFYIDKIELFKGGRRVISHGVDNLKGWCLSTDPEDANNSWKDRTANGCQPSQFFSYSDSGSSQPTATEYKVVIDNCHSSIGNEGTANTITVEFLNANRVVKTTSNKDIKECSSNAVFTIQSNENITGVNVTTNGNDGFYIDKIELFKGGRRVISHGVDNLKGWCLSTDPEDANNSWKDRTANGCQPSQFFSYSDSGSSQPTATEYKVVIDNCHSSIGNEGTANTITVEFLNANRVVKTTSNKDIKECSSNAVFTIQSNENITGVNVTTNGNDGFYIDKIELFKGGRRVISHGVDNLKGWCLSTDPEDANNSWKDRTANGCQPSQFFSYSDSGSSQPTATEYKVVIDNCHSSIGNEGTANTITVEFLNANRVVKTTSNKDIKECSSNAVFTIQSNENITGVNVTTNGNDGFYIDKIELFKGGRRVISHGVDNLKGWCLSTDPEDANNSWKDRTANGCQPSQFFSYSSI